MRGTVSKRLRRQAYEDTSIKKRIYRWQKHPATETKKWDTYTLVCADKRAEYLNLKERYKNGKTV